MRFIIRGKSKAPAEFGAKLAVSVVDGYMRIEQLSWDVFHEGKTLKETAESYHALVILETRCCSAAPFLVDHMVVPVHAFALEVFDCFNNGDDAQGKPHGNHIFGLHQFLF
ncbi:MAG: hypothetical protein ACOX63_00120 [Christensenellales bacterium]